MTCDMKILVVVLLSITCQTTARVVKRADGNPHDLMVPGQGMASQCLECKSSDKLNLIECLMQNQFVQCTSSSPECMTELRWQQGKLVFASECQQIEACIKNSRNEAPHNNCDNPPIHVSTQCRYCCDASTLTQGYYCPPPTSTVTCYVCGDPRFHTFDGYWYHQGGDCDWYTLLKMDCGDHDIDVQISESEHKGHYRVETMRITQEGQTLDVGVNNNDGTDVEFTLPGETITIADFPEYYGTVDQFLLSQSGDNYTIHIDIDRDGWFDLVIRWKFRKVELELTQPYSGCFDVTGLCGNADGFSQYDWIRPDGLNATSDDDFHESWGIGCPA